MDVWVPWGRWGRRRGGGGVPAPGRARVPGNTQWVDGAPPPRAPSTLGAKRRLPNLKLD